MADPMLAIAARVDQVGRVLATFERPNGLRIERISPIGVIDRAIAQDLSAAIALGCLPLLTTHSVPAAIFSAIEGRRS